MTSDNVHISFRLCPVFRRQYRYPPTSAPLPPAFLRQYRYPPMSALCPSLPTPVPLPSHVRPQPSHASTVTLPCLSAGIGAAAALSASGSAVAAAGAGEHRAAGLSRRAERLCSTAGGRKRVTRGGSQVRGATEASGRRKSGGGEVLNAIRMHARQ